NEIAKIRLHASSTDEAAGSAPLTTDTPAPRSPPPPHPRPPARPPRHIPHRHIQLPIPSFRRIPLHGINDASQNPKRPNVRSISLENGGAQPSLQIFDLRAGVEARLDRLLEPFQRVAKERAARAQHFPSAGRCEQILEFLCRRFASHGASFPGR